jgi:hypothetical protein
MEEKPNEEGKYVVSRESNDHRSDAYGGLRQ